MHLAIIHNDDAGHGVYTGHDLVELFRQAGHDVIGVYPDVSRMRDTGNTPGAVVVSGGDGTVAKAAVDLCDGDVPMYVLPSGTSNNVAGTLGAVETIPRLIEQLESALPSRLDIGRVTGAPPHEQQTRLFVEAAGFGFIGSMLSEEHRPLLQLWREVRDRISAPTDKWQRAASGVARLVRHQPARYVKLIADGVELSGEYVAVQALNIRAIGPRIRLAPNADHADRKLDLLLVKPGDRDALAEYIEARLSPEHAPSMDTRRVTHIEMDWPEDHAHVDDKVWPPPGERDRPASVRVEVHGAVKLLVPPASR